MNVTRYASGLQLSFMPRLFPVNCYLVEEAEDWTLVDCALPYSAGGIMKQVRQSGKPLRRIVLTHAHDDHIGALAALVRELGDSVKVYISRRDARLLAGDRTLDLHEAQTMIRGGVPKKAPAVPDVLLEDGDWVGSLRAVAAPGHTPGSMAFLDTRCGTLLAGDAFQTRAGIAVSGSLKLLFPFPAMATWDVSTALVSARRLTELKPELLGVGHGRMLQEPVKAMQLAIRELEEKLMRRASQVRS
ncbi:MBL fold metallo-hydrolase [Paenibacillus sambharensis]|uniref:MBL fold metallo-hydrolase n=1 Tax=Paenibacillus sambharensis TaxID=1803190 RepID=A0A2W1KZR3_9BACL|nr:MBL fold metallo-hydrolase [Paenibacillus sambharensis]PZD93168.1 MBL fold metallo-hydrolase [Paenibacillus sambharensis]